MAKKQQPGTITLSFKPTVQALESRTMPDATILTRQPDYTSDFDFLDIPADAGVQVLGSSSNGQYLLLQSKATNLVRVIDATGTIRPQVSPPGQTNLFWLQRLSDGTNDLRLISSYDPPVGTNDKFATGQKGLGVAESVPGKFLNAVISDDGLSVAFLSGINAALFDSTLYATQGFGIDGGGQDCFVWRESTGRVELVSKTVNGFAIGASGGVTNPSISPDGKVVTFVSDFNAQSIANRTTGDGPYVLFIDANGTPDLFRYQQGDANPEPVSVLRVQRPPTPVDNTDNQFVMHQNVSVDPLGRYVTAGGAGFVALKPAPNGNNDAFRYTFDTTAGVPAKDNNPYATDVSNVDFSNFIFFQGFFLGQIATNLLPATVTAPATGNVFAAPTLTTAVDAGSVVIENAIVSLYNSDVVFTYRQLAPIANSKLAIVPGYAGNPSATGNDQYDLMQRGFINGRLSFRLVTAQVGTTTQGVGFLDLRPGAYSITPDATKLLFTSAASAALFVNDPDQLRFGSMVDTNKQFDIFQRDSTSTNVTSLVSAVTSAPNTTGLGASTLPNMTPDGIAIAFQSTVLSDSLANIPDGNGTLSDIFVRDRVQKQTLLTSSIPGSTSSGNGESTTAVVVRSAQANAEFFRSFEVLFSSSATDLQTAVPIDPANPQVFTASFPVFISSLPRSVSFSGGDNGFVTISRVDNKGNIIGTKQVTPFAGYKGEIRVATADFNGDGVPDVAVGAGEGGGPRVSILDGFTGRVLDNFFAFESSFTGGVYVGAGDMNGDGVPELVVGAGERGGPRVQVYDFKSGIRIFDQFAYESSSRTGVRVSTGDFNGDGKADIIIGAGTGGGPRVRVISGAGVVAGTQTVLADFFAFDSNERNGVNVSAADYNADGKADLVTGTGDGSRPRVIIYNAAYASISDPNYSPFGAPLSNPLRVETAIKFLDFFPFRQSDNVGARAVLRNIEGGQFAGLIVASGGDLPVIQTYSGSKRGTTSLDSINTPLLLQQETAYDSLFGSFGAWVG